MSNPNTIGVEEFRDPYMRLRDMGVGMPGEDIGPWMPFRPPGQEYNAFTLGGPDCDAPAFGLVMHGPAESKTLRMEACLLEDGVEVSLRRDVASLSTTFPVDHPAEEPVTWKEQRVSEHVELKGRQARRAFNAMAGIVGQLIPPAAAASEETAN